MVEQRDSELIRGDYLIDIDSGLYFVNRQQFHLINSISILIVSCGECRCPNNVDGVYADLYTRILELECPCYASHRIRVQVFMLNTKPLYYHPP
jgi:hypothetical protein